MKVAIEIYIDEDEFSVSRACREFECYMKNFPFEWKRSNLYPIDTRDKEDRK